MTIVVVGCSHRTTPLAILERTAVGPDAHAKLLNSVRASEHVAEAAILSTCNRTEVYFVAERFHGAHADVRDLLADVAQLPPEVLDDHLYVLHDDAAVDHLFAVAAGVDSAVVGESEILGQVRAAREFGRGEGAVGPVLEMLFRHAIETGKRARTETDISRGSVSVAHAAVAMATERLGDLAGRTVLILGAGDMAEGMARALADAGVESLVMVNRTWERAVALADEVGGTAARLQTLTDHVEQVDLILCGTGAAGLLVDVDEIAPSIDRRGGRPLLVVDVAVPRNVDPSVGQLDGVTLLDMEDIEAFAAASLARRSDEIELVDVIVRDEVARFAEVTSAREVAPLIVAMRSRAEGIRRAEVERLIRRAGLGDAERQHVEELSRALLAKLLHEPTVTLKAAAGTPRGDRLGAALRELFGLS